MRACSGVMGRLQMHHDLGVVFQPRNDRVREARCCQAYANQACLQQRQSLGREHESDV